MNNHFKQKTAKESRRSGTQSQTRQSLNNADFDLNYYCKLYANLPYEKVTGEPFYYLDESIKALGRLEVHLCENLILDNVVKEIRFFYPALAFIVITLRNLLDPQTEGRI